MTLSTLHTQFIKGVSYFKDKWIRGLDTPPVRVQLVIFEQSVMRPFDEACHKATPEELGMLEDQI